MRVLKAAVVGLLFFCVGCAQPGLRPSSMLDPSRMDPGVSHQFGGSVAGRAGQGGWNPHVGSPDALQADAEIWEKTVRKLRGRLMPPPGEPHEDRGNVARVVDPAGTLGIGQRLAPPELRAGAAIQRDQQGVAPAGRGVDRALVVLQVLRLAAVADVDFARSRSTNF